MMRAPQNAESGKTSVGVPQLSKSQAAGPRESWRPLPKVRPCLCCGRPRISTSASDRLHPKGRPAGELNEGEAAALVPG
jgi:hypothetical protein